MEPHTQGFVNHVRKRVRRIDGDRSEQGINLSHKKEVHRISAGMIEVRHRQDADALADQRRHELLVPTLVLPGHKGMQFTHEALQLLIGRESVRTGQLITVFRLLQQSGYAHFNEFVEIAGRDGQKLDSLEQRIAFVLSLLEHAPIEGQPGFMAIEIVAGIIQADSRCGQGTPPQWQPSYRETVNRLLQLAIHFSYEKSSDSFSVTAQQTEAFSDESSTCLELPGPAKLWKPTNTTW